LHVQIGRRFPAGDRRPPDVVAASAPGVVTGIKTDGLVASTTVEALHRIHDALRELAWRPFPSGHYCDSRGVCARRSKTYGRSPRRTASRRSTPSSSGSTAPCGGSNSSLPRPFLKYAWPALP
jgi:hypothetical protein